ncbi:MAG: hypothetical protein KatS3mg110_4705 [Pirellulaceae bacterium]|nr:MAG: hypothetical protein KatS3mg110_4705 [Pirellulaceae bacterium]
MMQINSVHLDDTGPVLCAVWKRWPDGPNLRPQHRNLARC